MMFKRLCIAAGGVITLALAASACTAPASLGAPSASPSGSPIGPLEKTSLTVGALPVNDDAPLYLAIKDGFFKRAGLTVKPLTLGASVQAIPDMIRGTVDIMAGANYVSFFQAADRGAASLKILADASHCTDSSFEVMALPDSGITGPAGLAGKTVAVNVDDSVQTLTLNSVLRANGVSPSSVNYEQVPFTDMVSALREHRVDAISAIEPYVTGSEEQDGAVPVVSQCTGPTANFPMSGYFATAVWARKYPNTAKAFARAIDEAQAAADSDQQAIRAMLPDYTKISQQTADVMSMGSYPATISVPSLQQVAVMMRSDGMLSKPLSIQPLIAG